MMNVQWRQSTFVAALLVCIAILLFVTHGLHAQDAIEQTTPMVPNEQAAQTVPFQRQAVGAYDAYRESRFVPGELLVGFIAGDTQALQQVLGDVQAAALESLDLRGLDGATGTANITGQRIRVPVGEEWAIMEKLVADPTVAFAVPNWIVSAADETTLADITDADDTSLAETETPFPVNDPFYESEQWYLPRINASRAWGLAVADDGFENAFTEVQVAVIDSGVDLNHPEFRNQLLSGKNYVTPGAQPHDDYGHGTHVAGLLGAVANNATGIAGVAPKVRIDPRKALDQFGNGTVANLSQAIRDAADAGADIINLSVQSPSPSVVLESAVQYAASKGALLIGAAGNAGISTVYWPAHYDDVMAIAATTYNDTKASYSNSGPEIEIAAPGGTDTISMLSTWPGGAYCAKSKTTPTQSSYCKTEGTSMAVAVATGAAAMVKSLRPSLSGAEIRQLLIETAHPLNQPANFVGSGRLDIYAALRKILPPTLEFSHATLARDVFSGTLPYTVTLRLDNPSSTPLDWRGELLTGENFVDFHGAISNTMTSTVRYGEPVYLSLTISPTHLSPGSHAATLKITELLPDNTQRPHLISLTPLIWPLQDLHYLYFPVIMSSTASVIPETGYQWENPLVAEDRKTYQLFDNNSVMLSLPFTFTLRGQEFTEARLYSDGFLRFPDTDIGESLPNHCLPNITQPAQAVYGWWSDLDPTISGARISSFAPSADRFVVEFMDVASAVGVMPAYRVSFQIVLYNNGDIRLNYRNTPSIGATLPPVTVGVETRDGLFFNQVACKDDVQEIGYLPLSRQSLLFQGQGDFY